MLRACAMKLPCCRRGLGAAPERFAGNSSLRLISVDGGENDDVAGRMLPTPQLLAPPYIRQVLASFGVVWSRSRLMRLAPGAVVPDHADINHHWFSRVRLHIPVLTHPEVVFHCGDERVHMAAGEAWMFDNWRLHRVANPTTVERIHLVADTSGTAAFWRLVAQAETPGSNGISIRLIRADTHLLTEHSPDGIMPAPRSSCWWPTCAQNWWRRQPRCGERHAPGTSAARGLLPGLAATLCAAWRSTARPAATSRTPRDAAQRFAELGQTLVMRTNRVAAHQVLEARVLRHLLALPAADEHWRQGGRTNQPSLRAPVFIVAAPRSGSTLLFETLAAHRSIATLGGEAHWLVEDMPELRPGASVTDSNRLTQPR